MGDNVGEPVVKSAVADAFPASNPNPVTVTATECVCPSHTTVCGPEPAATGNGVAGDDCVTFTTTSPDPDPPWHLTYSPTSIVAAGEDVRRLRLDGHLIREPLPPSASATPGRRPTDSATARLLSKVNMRIRFTTSPFESDRPVEGR